jgi:putative transcriptional regulator
MLRQVKSFAPGLLVAMPQLGDPNFHRSVVLMIEHNPGGAMGLVLNHSSPLRLKDLADGHSLSVASEREIETVFTGGPVEPQRGFVLHDQNDVEEKHEVLPGLFLSLTLDALGPLLQNRKCRMRFCLGYAGWGPRQLESEITSGAWLLSDAVGPATLDTDPEQLWDATVRAMGFDPAMLLSGVARGVN